MTMGMGVMSVDHRKAVEKIMHPSLRKEGVDALQFAALCNALDATAVDGERWLRGAEAFIASLSGGGQTEQAYLDALNVADPSGESVQNGIDALNRLAKRMEFLSTLSNGWALGETKPISGVSAAKAAPDDPYAKLMEFARTTADQMKQRGKPTNEYKGDDGKTVQGWLIETYGEYREEEHSDDYQRGEEYWGRNHLVLTTEEEFYYLAFSGHKEWGWGKSETTLTDTLRECPVSYLAGSKGKPFSEMMGKLERLPWTR